MFAGRKREQEELERYYNEDTFHFAVFYGRRRVGKTTLINRFTGDKKSIYFTAAALRKETALIGLREMY